MRILKLTINSIFLFILFLIFTGGFFLSTVRGRYEISRIAPFVVLLWVLITIDFVISRAKSEPFPKKDLLPFQATDFLLRAFGDLPPKTLRRLGLILSALFAGTLIICSICKYYSFNAYMWDLGFFDNLLWNTSIGNFYKVATVFKPYQNVLGDHIHPIILVFVPFYKIHPTPVWFLLFQPIIVVIGALGVIRLANAVFKDQALAFLFFVAFLMYLPIRKGILFDFHESCFFPPVYVWMFVYYVEGKYKRALALLALSFTVKETAGLFNAVLLLSILFGNQTKTHKVRAVVLAVVSLTIFLVEIEVLIPYFRGGTEYEYSRIYGNVGGTPIGIAKFLFAHPVSFLQKMLQPDKLLFTFKVLAPLAFLSLFSLRGFAIVTVPLIVLTLPDDPKIYSTLFLFHYGLNLAPFVFLSAILGLKNLQRRFPKAQRRVIFFLILWLSLAFYDKSEIMRIKSFWPTKEDFQLHNFLRNIPEEKSVRSITTLVPHFSERNHFGEATWQRPLPDNEDYYIVPTFYLKKPEVVSSIREQNYTLLQEIRKVSIFVKK